MLTLLSDEKKKEKLQLEQSRSKMPTKKGSSEHSPYVEKKFCGKNL